jgi:hypothetical protein
MEKIIYLQQEEHNHLLQALQVVNMHIVLHQNQVLLVKGDFTIHQQILNKTVQALVVAEVIMEEQDLETGPVVEVQVI